MSEAVVEVPRVRGKLGVVVRRELWSLLTSPVSYLILFFFYLFRGIEVASLTSDAVRIGADADGFVVGYFATASMQFAAILVPPILTMRAFAEEKRSGSLELLMTAPVRDYEVVLGKWFASWVFFTLLWTPSILLVFLFEMPGFLAADFALGQMLTCCVGLFALGSLLLSVGLFTSAVTDNQLLAALSAMLFGYGLLALPQTLARELGTTARLDVDSGVLLVLLDQSRVSNHLGNWFFRGLMDTGHLVFYLSTTALFLFLCVRVVESRKWR